MMRTHRVHYDHLSTAWETLADLGLESMGGANMNLLDAGYERVIDLAILLRDLRYTIYG